MFTGIDEVDWASLGHAYGPADDVPAMLRGLASTDPAEREIALDGMYGAVHHQGDVYDSTLACIPFLLELVATREVPDRGCIIELLTSIGGIDLGGDDEMDELDPDGEEFEDAANYAMAAAAVAAGADVFLGLVCDDDPEVRIATAGALALLHGEPARVLVLLRERLTVEPDTEVRLALVEAVGRIALRYESLRDETVDWLGWLTHAAQDPGLRLAALAQLARCAPGRLPSDVVTTVTGLLAELRENPRAPAPTDFLGARDPRDTRELAGPGEPGDALDAVELRDPPDGARPAPTLVGQLRELREEQTAGRSSAWADDLLRTLHGALDDRVDDRIALVTAQLRSPDWGQRADAVWMCGGLVRTWRGSYDEVVRLVGAQLADPEPRLREAAAAWLENLFCLARPAADALAAKVTADPAPWAPERLGGRFGVGSALLALTRAGDARAVPALARALEQPDLNVQLAYAIPHLADAGAPLAPALRRRLGGLPLDDELADQAGPLLLGLAHLRAVEALPEVLRVLRGAPAYRQEWVRESALRAVAAFGPPAGDAAPELRGLLDHDAVRVATAAARALWAVEGDAGAALAKLRALLLAPDIHDRREPAWALGAIGGAAAAAAPELRACLSAREMWLRVDAGVALCRVTGDVQEALPVLMAAWKESRHTRVEIAECFAEMGPGAAEAAAPLLRAELARPRRHNASEGSSGDHDIHHDEKLLALCRRALGHGEGQVPG
ncbi:HEAT repeat domain-containing protein [Streptomyces sp. SP18CS02]|uniref:HEAT repeat domain-containing protein n=1 Tax=Streptomyces sp. SP18CS02 TaxID=3002531 RepID=UPI002E764B1D|nr:PBS lyase [Streptomyces sp. SP18CS02]MEE1757218.1 PBS lyase [Streptomyces sp. SP18CS02]